MAVEWQILKKDRTTAQWAGLYVTINRIGTIAMNRSTHLRLGKPQAFQIMFDKANARIGLRPSILQKEHAYRVCVHGRSGGRVVRANRLLKEFGLKVPDTLEFQDVEIDANGILILNLRTAKISPKAHSQCRKPKMSEQTAN